MKGRLSRDRGPTPRWVAVLVLSLATMVWGASFVVAKSLVADYDPMSVLVLRFAIGTGALWVLRPGAVRVLTPADRWHAALIGLIVGVAQVPHYFGIRETSASVAAFLIGTYVVVTPLLGRVLYGVRTSRTASVGALLALGGLATLAIGGSASWSGLALCLVAAVLYALQISSVGAWVPGGNIWGFTTVNLAVITAVLAVPASLRGLELPVSLPDWLRLLYLALIAGVAAIAMQTWAQRRIPATQAAAILVMEPVWATGLAVLLTHEGLTPQLVLGGAVLLAANCVVALGSRAVAAPPQVTHNA